MSLLYWSNFSQSSIHFWVVRPDRIFVNLTWDSTAASLSRAVHVDFNQRIKVILSPPNCPIIAFFMFEHLLTWPTMAEVCRELQLVLVGHDGDGRDACWEALDIGRRSRRGCERRRWKQAALHATYSGAVNNNGEKHKHFHSKMNKCRTASTTLKCNYSLMLLCFPYFQPHPTSKIVSFVPKPVTKFTILTIIPN